MGCGKSTVGREIAQREKVMFLDTDAWIEEKEQMSISSIFVVKGEAYFRDLETRCLESLLSEEKEYEKGGAKIFSVGGGLPMREENRKLLQQLGTVIYLKATPDTIYERIKEDTTRPLLQGVNPKQKIIDMMAIREEMYQDAAEIVIHVDEKAIDKIAEEIRNHLE